MLENTWKYFCMNSPVLSNLCFWSFCVFGVLCHNFWTNWDKDMLTLSLPAVVMWYSYMGWFRPVPVGIGLSISKWPFELQFCKRYPCSWQKMALNSHKLAIYQLQIFSNWWIHENICLSVFMNILMKNWVTET